MNTLAPRRGRSTTRSDPQAISDHSKPALGHRDVDESPSRIKELSQAKQQTRPLVIIFLSFTFLVGAYLYHSAVPQRVNGQSPSHPVSSEEVRSLFRMRHRYVTIVLPSVVNPKERRHRLEAIARTWGNAGHAIYVIHNLAEEFPSGADGSGTNEFPRTLVVPPNITFDDGLPRLNFVFRQIYENYDFDFAFFANDHTYIIPSHLCFFLQDKSPTNKLYAGHALKNEREAFNSGAAGYFVSRESVRQLVQKLSEEDEFCVVKPGSRGQKWLQGNPGLVSARCFHHSLDTRAIDTRESGKYHRFHAYGIVRTAMGKVDDWYVKKHQNLKDINGFDDSYAALLAGDDCCSRETCSFHYVEWRENLALTKIRENLLKDPDMTDAQLQELILQEWPKEWKELGGYSRLLPDSQKEQESWNSILKVMRKISLKEYETQC